MNLPKIANIKVNKKELLVVLILLLFSIACFLLFRVTGQGRKIQIEIAQKLYGTYDLSINQEIKLFDENGSFLLKCVIENNKAYIVTSNCPDKICIDEGSIEQAGQTIVCLPNMVVISIIGDDSNIDGVLK